MAVMIAVEVTVLRVGALAVLRTVMVVIEGNSAGAVDKTVLVGTGAVTTTKPLLVERDRLEEAVDLSFEARTESKSRRAVFVALAADEVEEVDDEVEVEFEVLSMLLEAEDKDDGLAVTVTVMG